MTRTAVVFVGLLLASTVAGTGVVTAAEDPRFEVYVAQETLTPGTQNQVSVTIVNDAAEPDDRVETARSVEATMRAGDTPFAVTSGTRLLGTVGDGVPSRATFGLDVPENVESGTYRLPIDVTYEYEGDERETTTVYATVRVADRAAFAVVDTGDDTRVGSVGTVNVTVENVGSAPANDASVELASTVPALTFGGASATNRYAGSWEPGERKTVTFEVTVSSRAEPRPYALTATVAYDDQDGVPRTSIPLTASVTPAPERRFAVTAVGSDLRVGSDGHLRVRVTNDGDEAVDDAVVHLKSQGTAIHPERREYGLGSLDPGEAATATFPLEIGEDTGSGPRRFAFTVAYDRSDGDRISSAPIGLQVPVGPERARFDLTVRRASVPAGGAGSVVLEVTNTGEEPLRAVDAKAFTDAPFTVTDDAAFVGDLGPGETKTISFAASVPDGAQTKDYPLSVDFQYEMPDGETHLSETYDVPVGVTPAPGPPTILLAGGATVAVLAIAGLGYWISRD
ncbi:MAG: hypothetical protein ABEJ76_06500 [Halanaeroarchaeum sp.]